jgi:hypothetical protein
LKQSCRLSGEWYSRLGKVSSYCCSSIRAMRLTNPEADAVRTCGV